MDTVNLSSEEDIRREKIRKLREQNEIVYKEKFVRTNTLLETKSLNDGEKVRVCGRITF